LRKAITCFAIILFLISGFENLALSSINDSNQATNIEVFCSTSGDIFLSDVTFIFVADAEGDVSIVSLMNFESRGFKPVVNFILEGHNTAGEEFGNGTVEIDGYSIAIDNGRGYWPFWQLIFPDNVSSEIPPALIIPEVRFSQRVYRYDITDLVINAQRYFFSELGFLPIKILYPNIQPEDLIVRGRISFSAKILGGVGEVKNKHYFRLSMSAYDVNATSISIDITIPEEATIIEAKIDEEDLNKILPNRYKETIFPPLEHRVYMEWEMPKGPDWWETPPGVLAIGILGGIIVAIIVYIFRSTIWDRYIKPHLRAS